MLMLVARHVMSVINLATLSTRHAVTPQSIIVVWQVPNYTV